MLCQCDVLNSSWPLLFPDLAGLPSASVCAPEWDGASCLPPSPASSLAVFPCMTLFNQKLYSTYSECTVSVQSVTM